MAIRIHALLLVVGIIAAEDANIYHCKRSESGFPKELCYTTGCADAINGQIKHELNAAFKYMCMGAKFAQYTVDRPGIAKFLMEAATEERGHASLMLDYLNTRGIKPTVEDDYNFPFNKFINETKNISYKDALQEALRMEIEVTDLIYDVVSACHQDYHGADVFTNPILDEQHNGVRKLQGAIRAFDDLSHNNDVYLAEYIFDQKMLRGEF
uniref:Ferritin n=1 Tax=Astacus astacus TaxID=6715 RepID=A0A146MGH3_ASTAS